MEKTPFDAALEELMRAYEGTDLPGLADKIELVRSEAKVLYDSAAELERVKEERDRIKDDYITRFFGGVPKEKDVDVDNSYQDSVIEENKEEYENGEDDEELVFEDI